MALGLAAIQKRLHVKFTTVAAMVANLTQALTAGTYAPRLRTPPPDGPSEYEEDRGEMLPSERQRRFDNRVGWAITYLR